MLDNLLITTLRNHQFVEVPWERADELRNRLEAKGIRATACYEPSERQAGLEIHHPMDPEHLRSILCAPEG